MTLLFLPKFQNTIFRFIKEVSISEGHIRKKGLSGRAIGPFKGKVVINIALTRLPPFYENQFLATNRRKGHNDDIYVIEDSPDIESKIAV